MLFAASIVLFILKVTVFPALAWWMVALPALIGIGIWVIALLVSVLAVLFAWKTLD